MANKYMQSKYGWTGTNNEWMRETVCERILSCIDPGKTERLSMARALSRDPSWSLRYLTLIVEGELVWSKASLLRSGVAGLQAHSLLITSLFYDSCKITGLGILKKKSDPRKFSLDFFDNILQRQLVMWSSTPMHFVHFSWRDLETWLEWAGFSRVPFNLFWIPMLASITVGSYLVFCWWSSEPSPFQNTSFAPEHLASTNSFLCWFEQNIPERVKKVHGSVIGFWSLYICLPLENGRLWAWGPRTLPEADFTSFKRNWKPH